MMVLRGQDHADRTPVRRRSDGWRLRMLSARTVVPEMHGEIGARCDRQGEAEREHDKSVPTPLSPTRLFDERLRVDERLVSRQRLDNACPLFDDSHPYPQTRTFASSRFAAPIVEAVVGRACTQTSSSCPFRRACS
jgi:hypothetical protein